MLRPSRVAMIGVILMGTLTACGVSLQSSAEPLPANAIPAPLTVPSQAPVATPSPSPTPSAIASPEPTVSRLRLWFVQEGGLAAVESTLPVGSSPDLVIQSLAIGPTAEQAAEGLRTVARDPLTGLALVSVAVGLPTPTATVPEPPTAAPTAPPVFEPTAAPASVTVVLGSAFSALPPVEQVLLLGQVVLSLAGSGETSVLFTDEAGSPVAVPLPDGRLLDVPATARDYSSLIVRP